MDKDYSEIFKIENLFLRSKYILKGYFSGIHKTPYKGFSSEFSEYREYIQGDDFKRIDWKVFLRSEKLFVRENEGESDTDIYIFLDCSKSMRFANKFEYAKTLVFIFALIAKKQNDSFGYVFYSDRLKVFQKPSKKQNLLSHLYKDLERIKPDGETKGAKVLLDILPKVKRSTFVIFITDFGENLEDMMKTLSIYRVFKNDSIVFHLQSKQEFEKNNFENVYLKDMESGKTLYFDSFSDRMKILRDRNESIKKYSYENGIDYNHIMIEDGFEKPLSNFFFRRKNVFL